MAKHLLCTGLQRILHSIAVGQFLTQDTREQIHCEMALYLDRKLENLTYYYVVRLLWSSSDCLYCLELVVFYERLAGLMKIETYSEDFQRDQ